VEIPGRVGDLRPAFAGDEKSSRATALADGACEAGAQPIRPALGETEERIAEEKGEDLASGRAERVEVAGEIAGEIEPPGESQATALVAEEEIEERSRWTVEDEVRALLAEAEDGTVGLPDDDEPPTAREKPFEGEAAADEREGDGSEIGVFFL
jgi:hypothetical protein